MGQGTPEELAERNTLTGGFLKPLLDEYSNDDCSSVGEVDEPSAINGFQSERGERDLVVRGQVKTTSAMWMLKSPSISLPSLLGSADLEKRHWPLIPSLQRDKLDMLNPSLPMPEDFLAEWIRPLWIALMDWHQQLRSIKSIESQSALNCGNHH